MQKYASSTSSNSLDAPQPGQMSAVGKQTLAGQAYAQGVPAPSTGPQPTLKVGSTGPAVTELQQKLGIPADGQFGPQTRAAVVAFQQQHGLGADGVVGPMTWGAINGAPAAAPAAPATPAAPAATPAPTSTPAADFKQGGEAATPAATPAEAPPELNGLSGARAAIVSAARSKIGTVYSDVAAAADETGDQTRQGWETLTEIFAVGFPEFEKKIIKYIKYGKNNGKAGSTGNGLVSWCGIFATWATMTGGGNCGTWMSGSRCSAMSKLVKDPKPGDVGYFTANQHHCIIASVNGDQIETIDGNSYDGSSGGNGAITSRMRSRHDFQGFFRNVND